MRSPGFQWYVAWRYLMARPRRLSGAIIIAIAVFIWVAVAAGLGILVDPLTDEYLAAGAPVPVWFPIALGCSVALPTTLLAIHAAYLAAFARPRPSVRMLRVAGGLVVVGALAFVVYWRASWAVALPLGAVAASVAGSAMTGATLLILFGRARHLSLSLLGLAAVGAICALAMLGVLSWKDVEGGELSAWIEIWGVAGGALLVPWIALLHTAMRRLAQRPGRGIVAGLVVVVGVLVIILVAVPVLYFAGYGVVAHDTYSLADRWQVWELAPAALFGIAALAFAVRAAVRRGRSAGASIRLAALLGVLAALSLVAVREFWMLRLVSESIGPSSFGASGSSVLPPIWLIIPLSLAITLIGLSCILLGIRYFFTFFTTVSMGGVAIGTMALVITLSVMSGFETDLRGKILGSNAHVLITRHDEAPFPGYRTVMEKAALVSGVVAETPYLTSEVVIAGSSNYFNVVIKGIDPATIARVTDLGQDLDDDQALQRMWPLTEAGQTAGSPEPASPRPDEASAAPPPGTPDPAPPDLEIGGEGAPVDWSGSGSVPPTSDPAPADLGVGSDSPPVDWSGQAGQTAVPPAEPLVDGDDAAGRGRSLDDTDDWLPPPARELDAHVAALPGVLVGRELVKQINLYEGQEVKIISPLGQNTVVGQTPYIKPYRIAGTFFTGMYEYDLKRIYVELGTLQDFLDLPDEVTGIEIRVTDPEETDAVILNLRRVLGPDFTVQDWKELNRSLFSALKLEKIAMFLVLAVIILVASFSIVGNLIMVVVEKQREIAVLKTLGASDAGVTRVFIVQGLFIGLVGTAIGMVLGLGSCFLADRYGLRIPAEVYYIDRLPIHIEPLAVVLVAAAALIISVGATIYPAQIAARLRPVQGLRFE